MKTGKSLSELATEIERQATTKKDFIGVTGKMSGVEMVHDLTGRPGSEDEPRKKENANFGGIALQVADKGRFPINDIAHDQIAEHVKIPKVYYDRMRTNAPDLLATNVNRWFEREPQARMIRTLDGRARAFLSDKYNALDNYDFGHAVLPLLADRKLEVMSCEITERRLYIKAVDTALFRDVPVGYKMGDGSHRIFETCAPAIILANSEVGYGRLVIESGVYTRACTNLCLFSAGGFKRTHVGARHRLTEGMDATDLDAIMSDSTRRKTMEALWLQVRDVVASAFDQKVVTKRAEIFEAAAGRAITKPVEKVMEVVQDRFGLNDGERESVFQHLIKGGALNQYGLHAAITRAAQDVESYDRATELEYLGGKVIELPRTDWQALAEAA